jgi:hypothetical protein
LPLWVDHKPRIEFYVRAGLVPAVPTDDQLGRAFEKIRTRVGVSGQLRYYLKHPAMILPTARKRAATRLSIDAIARDGFEPPEMVLLDSVAATVPGQPLFDRSLERLFLFTPARFAVQALFNPWALVPSSGLNTPRRYLINHILHTNHPPPAIWDAQIVQADPGGLEELERELERAMRRASLRARVDRALGCREGYYEHLREWIPRLRRFEFPPIPRNLDPIGENIVDYLRYALET